MLPLQVRAKARQKNIPKKLIDAVDYAMATILVGGSGVALHSAFLPLATLVWVRKWQCARL